MAGVLVVEDDEQIRVLLEQMLRDMGFDTFCATDGQHTLELLEAFEPDLMVIDILMPRIDGAQLIDKIRQLGNKVPIIVISGTSDRSLISLTLEKGGSLFLEKPINFNDLFEAVRSLLPPLDHLMITNGD